MSTHNVCVPMKLDAFRLNPAACNDPSRLGPISQPEYIHLRLDETIRHDVQHDVDLHNTARGPTYSDRVTDLATGELKRNRFGIYLHWLIPRFYRTGLAVSQSSEQDAEDLRRKRGYRSVDESGGDPDPQSPTYRPLPTRWVVLRHLLSKTPQKANIPEFQAFIIESDRLRTMDQLGPEVDIQVDVSPFVYMGGDRQTLDLQAETFIGFKQPLDDWTESTDSKILRAPLSVLNSVNPLLADYQPHNSNVFSMIDNFAYDDGTSRPAYLESAKANYYVIGWHPHTRDDPFHLFDQPLPYPTHADRLNACFMKFADSSSSNVSDWAESSLSLNDLTHTIAHGAIYEVEWDLNKKPAKVPADDIARSYNACSPVAVGVNPIDALLAVTHAHALTVDSNKSSNDDSKPDPLAQDILSLQTLIIKQEEDPDSQLQGADILYDSYFKPSDGGQRWHVSGTATGTEDGKRPTIPAAQELKDLNTVNEYQLALDHCTREMKWLQWLIWAEWWKFVTYRRPRTEDEKEDIKVKVDDMFNRHSELNSQTSIWKTRMSNIISLYNWECVASPRFYGSRDPTLLLCGIKSGWPTDYDDFLKVRLDSQLVTVDDIYDGNPEGWSDVLIALSKVSQKLPASIQDAAKALLTEFYVLRPVPKNTLHLRSSPTDNILYPLYHDCGPDADTADSNEQRVWRDRWNGTQAWFPLFVEWEIEYFHINADYWVPAPRRSYGPPKLYAQIDQDKDISNITNKRLISGRSLALPQTTAMLKQKVEQLLKNNSKTSADLGGLHALINKLEFLTMTISGVSGQLTTGNRGSHVSPTMYRSGYGPQPLEEAIVASKNVINKNAISLMINTTITPFGDFPDFSDAQCSPFKPATHGQFRFTKLNIIDMFGQAVSAIDPTPKVPPPLYPYISEYYQCTPDASVSKPETRTVLEDGAQLMQLGPYMNQDSRLNMCYVKLDEGKKSWWPVSEYDNPIWGWFVVNYADRGLQVFLPDGTFYREIRLRGSDESSTGEFDGASTGGSDGTSAGVADWLPFDPPANNIDIPILLSNLLKKFRQSVVYLQEFFDVMVGALDSTLYTPNQYAGYFAAITGKPFALVSAGVSLELSHPPYVNQSTSAPSNAPAEPGLESYGFQIKFGDRDRTFDGLLGYFKADQSSPTKFDLEDFYTYFPSDDDDGLTQPIDPYSYPTLTPYYNEPGSGSGDSYTVKNPQTILKESTDRLTVFGMLVDPFTVVHAYTSFQPVQVLRLPEWALEQSLKKITAFFHLGPIIMPHDVPLYDARRRLASGSSLNNIPDAQADAPGFSIPAVGIADWAWLQPYYHSTDDSTDASPIAYNPFSLTAIDDQPKLGPTPYTAVEGYLYLKKPITSPNVQATPGQN
ncbi:hypothetical protein BYT27DRAFT_7166923 [Phlegmacium glaucopus]|nr:hypothetical protein BYT27DRAFT_7166923 [Phlegmacium glaucopus]